MRCFDESCFGIQLGWTCDGESSASWRGVVFSSMIEGVGVGRPSGS